MDWECKDIVVYDDGGAAVYRGPRFLRCSRQTECGTLVTHGMLAREGKCVCGSRKFNPALKVKPDEQEQILLGQIPLLDWEKALIEGTLTEVSIPQGPEIEPFRISGDMVVDQEDNNVES